jgi:hypothetical protein
MTKPGKRTPGAFGSVKKGKFIARTIDETNEVLNNLFQAIEKLK